MPRGGRRAGRQGVAYGNRTDLNTPAAKLPVAVGHSQVYGEGEQLRRAQQAVPMGGNPTGAPAPQAQPRPPAQLLPGDLPPLTRPTERPEEPLTAGMAQGPGAGPEILMPARAGGGRPFSVAQTLADLSHGDVSGELGAIYQWAAKRGL